MNTPFMVPARTVADGTLCLGAWLPVPGFGILPVNAFVIRGPEPTLVDTGLAALREPFMAALREAIDPVDLRWIWITHADPDHLGNLEAVLAEAPHARVVTTYLGMGKMGLHGLPVERAWLLNPGQRLEIGDRELVAVVPPTFDAPETTGLFDTRSRAYFSADSFGALMHEPADTADAIGPAALRDGMVTWATVDAPWLDLVDPRRHDQRLEQVRRLDPALVLSGHLPPAAGMTDTLLQQLAAARTAPPFEGPDHHALERLMESTD